MTDRNEEQAAGDGACLHSERVHQGRIVDLRIDTVRFPDGSTGDLEMVRHSGAAAVVPLVDPPDAEDPRVILIRQYRYAADGYILEIPAGRPDEPGEPWEACARREMEEETGWRAGSLRPLTMIHTTPGFTDEKIHIFLATDLEKGAVDRDSDEFLEVETMPMSEVLDLIRDGTITDAKTICGVLYAAGFIVGL